MRFVLHILFHLGFGAAFWQYFEMMCKLTVNEIIKHPIWSGLFGFPFPHHGYWGFALILFSYALLSKRDFIQLWKSLRNN